MPTVTAEIATTTRWHHYSYVFFVCSTYDMQQQRYDKFSSDSVNSQKILMLSEFPGRIDGYL